MIGAIVGDIAGSRFEGHNYRAKDFDFFHMYCRCTDDSGMTLAVADAILHSRPDFSDLGEQAVRSMQAIGRAYPRLGYGRGFRRWIFSDDPRPYNSYGNGSAMRVSACGYAGSSMEEGKRLSRAVTEVTHNHPDAIKGAEATAVAVYLARNGASQDEIRAHISEQYYAIDFTLDELRRTYSFSIKCGETVPQALLAFFEADDFEDAIRNAISLGGDSDTIGAITGAVAEACFGVPCHIRERALTFLDDRLRAILLNFESRWPPLIS